jgi:hypothetical protein
MEQESAPIAPHEYAILAGRHGLTEEQVRELVLESGSRSRREVEEALAFHSRLAMQEAVF